jgi:hypothetical protein
MQRCEGAGKSGLLIILIGLPVLGVVLLILGIVLWDMFKEISGKV